MKKRILGILLSLIMAVGMLPTMAMAQEPAPTFNLEKDLKDITIPEHLVTCICITTGESKPYGQLTGGFTTDGKVIKKNGEWTVIVQIKKSTYLKKFNADTGTTHFPDQDPNYSSDFTTPIQFKMKYEGGKWVLDGAMPEDKKLHFTCDGQHATQEPPVFDLAKDLEGIQIPENLVTCICTTTNESKTYGQLPEGFTTDGKVIKENGEWTVIVQIKKSTYLKKFNADTGTTHFPDQDPNYSSDFTTPIQFKMKYEGGKWVLDGAMPEDKKLHFTCDGQHATQEPPTLDNISGLNDKIVAVLCANTQDGQQSGKYYGLLNGGFTSTMPTREGDMYESTLTLIPSVYCNQYSTDTGIQHTVNPKQNAEDLTFVVKYDEAKKLWMPKEDDVKPMGIWVNCDKHEAQPQPPEMPMYPTIDNISGLNDKIVAVLCANTQAGQSSGKYYGLLNGGFTSTMPTREGDMYESTLTLIPSVYCNQYSTDTGIQHTVNPKQNAEDLTFVVKYDEAKKLWMPKEDDVKPMGIWVNCDKHETSTSVTPVYPPSGGGSTIKPGSNGSNQGDGAVVNPDNNQGDNKDKVDTGNKQTGKTKKSDTMEKVPKTGDNTAMTIWLVLLLFSVGALFGTVAFDRKRKRI